MWPIWLPPLKLPPICLPKNALSPKCWDPNTVTICHFCLKYIVIFIGNTSLFISIIKPNWVALFVADHSVFPKIDWQKTAKVNWSLVSQMEEWHGSPNLGRRAVTLIKVYSVLQSGFGRAAFSRLQNRTNVPMSISLVYLLSLLYAITISLNLANTVVIPLTLKQLDKETWLFPSTERIGGWFLCLTYLCL